MRHLSQHHYGNAWDDGFCVMGVYDMAFLSSFVMYEASESLQRRPRLLRWHLECPDSYIGDMVFNGLWSVEGCSNTVMFG